MLVVASHCRALASKPWLWRRAAWSRCRRAEWRGGRGAARGRAVADPRTATTAAVAERTLAGAACIPARKWSLEPATKFY